MKKFSYSMVKRFLCIAPLAVVLLLCGHQGALGQDNTSAKKKATEDQSGPKIAFDDPIYDFGSAQQGDKVIRYYSFKNVGDKPLVLFKVKTTCGCTASQWPRRAIPPGKEASVKVIFRTAGKMGFQDKAIKVLSNSVENSMYVLRLKGEVKKQPTLAKKG